MKCLICKKMARNLKNYNICSKCRSSTLRELINTKIINPEVFNKIIPTDKKGKVLALRNLTADTKQFRGSTIGENMSEDADNESVGNKHFFVEDNVIARDSVNKSKRGWGCPYEY